MSKSKSKAGKVKSRKSKSRPAPKRAAKVNRRRKVAQEPQVAPSAPPPQAVAPEPSAESAQPAGAHLDAPSAAPHPAAGESSGVVHSEAKRGQA